MIDAMSACCPHSEAEHVVVATCEEVIHYPSEDYPCLCTGFVAAEDARLCASCHHSRTHHGRWRVCKPASGAFCACRQRAS